VWYSSGCRERQQRPNIPSDPRCSCLATYEPEPIGHLLFAVKEVSHDLQAHPQGPRS
jgi:hypothetical protein